MTAIIFVTSHNDDTLEAPEVIIEVLRDRPLQSFTSDQLETMPPTFRCYGCLEVFERTYLGGFELEQKLCKNCYPWHDQKSVWGIIKFDIKHGSPVPNFGQTKHRKEKVMPKIDPEMAEKLAWMAERDRYWEAHWRDPH